MIDDTPPLIGSDGIGYYDSEEVPAPEPVAVTKGDFTELWNEANKGRKLGRNQFKPDIVEQILDNVEKGAFPHVAAQAVGVNHTTLQRWCNDRRPEYLAFTARLEQAKARARLSCESTIKGTKPLEWLRLGPGRDFGDPARPGWTDPAVKVEGRLAHAHLHYGAMSGGSGPVDLEAIKSLAVDELKILEGLLERVIKRPALSSGASDNDDVIDLTDVGDLDDSE